MEYEYSQGIRDKNKVTQKANQVLREIGMNKFLTNPTIKIGKRGYRLIYVPTRGWVKEHHYIWEQHNGPVPKGMCIHHIDQNKLNNKIENLRLMTISDHHKLHYAERIINELGQFKPKDK